MPSRLFLLCSKSVRFRNQKRTLYVIPFLL